MNTDFLSKILTNDDPYWVVRKNNTTRNKSFEPSIIMIAIPISIRIAIKREDIKLVDLERLQNINIDGNVFLNENYPPFQSMQTLSRMDDGFPITCNPKEFLKNALYLETNDLYEYKKLNDELKAKETKATNSKQ